jgi:hypothetical protein
MSPQATQIVKYRLTKLMSLSFFKGLTLIQYQKGVVSHKSPKYSRSTTFPSNLCLPDYKEEVDIQSINHYVHSKLTSLILLGILVGLFILAFRPFGFRTFVHGLEIHSLFPLLLVTSIIGVCMVLLQRAGVIFAEDYV